MIRSNHEFNRLFSRQETLELKHTLARHDDLLNAAFLAFHGRLAISESVAIRRDSTKDLAIRFHQHAIQVIANVLLGHREVGAL